MKLYVPAVFLLVGLAFCGGCRTFYQEAQEARHDAMFGTGEIARQRAARMADSTVNRKLGRFELARLKMLQGDFSGSSAIFAPQLDELFDETNEGPILKKGQIAGNILAGTVADDLAIPYELPPFELLFGLQYQALNSLCLGELDNARVYLRRATAVQEQLKEENEKHVDGNVEVAQGESSDSTKEENAKNVQTASTQIIEKLSPVADTVRASYENALAWYLMGLFFAKENDSNADIAFREAARISPGIAPFAKPAPGAGQDVIVVYEEDLVDSQEPIKIPLPFGGTIWSVDFPVYGAPAHVPAQIVVEVGGAMAATCVPVVNVQALAYRNLRDRIPGVVTRNVTRAAVKIAAQQAANHIKTGNSYANIAMMAGVFTYNAFSTAISEADTRAWQTVPEHVHLARIRLPADRGSVVLRNAITGKACEVTLPKETAGNGTRVVWFTDVRGFATVSMMTIGGKGMPTWARAMSLL
jgi:hypothetical protein